MAAPNKKKLKGVFGSLLLQMFLPIKNGRSENQKSFLCEKNHFPFYGQVKKNVTWPNWQKWAKNALSATLVIFFFDWNIRSKIVFL